MDQEDLEMWQEAIRAWNGEDEESLEAFIDAIRGAMKPNGKDFAAAHAMCQDLMRHDFENIKRAEIYLYAALTGPGEFAKVYLDVAMDNIEAAIDVGADDPKVKFWKERIEKVQARLTPVNQEPIEGERGNKTANAALALRPGKGKGFAAPSLLTPSAATIANPALSLDGAGGLSLDGVSDVATSGTTSQFTEAETKRVAEQLAKRVGDQKRRQNLSKLPRQKRRAAANKSFRIGGGAAGTLKSAPSRTALFDIFKKDEPAEEEASEASKDVLTGAEGGLGREAASQGGEGGKKQEDELPVPDWTAQYNKWVQEAGVATSEEEYYKIYNETMEQMRAQSRGQAAQSAFNEGTMDERSMSFD